jgi:hypothetical protein
MRLMPPEDLADDDVVVLVSTMSALLVGRNG